MLVQHDRRRRRSSTMEIKFRKILDLLSSPPKHLVPFFSRHFGSMRRFKLFYDFHRSRRHKASFHPLTALSHWKKTFIETKGGHRRRRLTGNSKKDKNSQFSWRLRSHHESSLFLSSKRVSVWFSRVSRTQLMQMSEFKAIFGASFPYLFETIATFIFT